MNGYVEKHHEEVPYHLLRCDDDLSAGDPGNGNLLVEGDNLLALKALLPYYAGQVKCIYIDPPYNTGNQEWKYNDAVNSPEIREWLGQTVGKEADDLCRHDKWLCMMYPRLALLKRFLRPDGILFVSIDDVEIDSLRLILDELFGRQNRIGTIVWKNATDNNPTRIVPEHEYVLCYARNASQGPSEWKSKDIAVKTQLIQIGEEFCSRYSEADERQAEYSKWFRKNRPYLWPFQDYKLIDDGGIYTGMRSVHNPGKEGYRYDVMHRKTGKPCQQPLMGYRFPPETMRQLLDENRILFGEDETKIIELKVYAKDYQAKLSSVFELDGRRGTNEIKAIFPESKRAFNFPKPTGLIQELLAFTTSGDDIILDSFAGSGTTGHAVMQLNKLDRCSRRWVLVELDAQIAADITAARLRRVIAGHKTEGGSATSGLGGGFRYCRLSHPIFDETGQISAEVTFADLAAHVFFTETGEPIPRPPQGTHPSPLLGIFNGMAIYLLFNGILGDKAPRGGNVLTREVLAGLPRHDGPRVIYGTSCRLGDARLKSEKIIFKQIPYEVRVS